MHVFGTDGHLEVKIPFNAPNASSHVRLPRIGAVSCLDEITIHAYPVADQYTLMGDAFSKAILEDS